MKRMNRFWVIILAIAAGSAANFLLGPTMGVIVMVVVFLYLSGVSWPLRRNKLPTLALGVSSETRDCPATSELNPPVPQNSDPASL